MSNSTKSSRHPQSFRFPLLYPNNEPSQNLLQVGAFPLQPKHPQPYAPQNKFKVSRKKSHKSLGNNLLGQGSLAFTLKKRKKGLSTQAVQKGEPKQEPSLDPFETKVEKTEPLKARNEAREKGENDKKQSQFHFQERKMRIGRRGKVDLMKQFILETLGKGQAEGNCLTIQKGTAQCRISPKKEETKQQQHSPRLVLPVIERGPPKVQRGVQKRVNGERRSDNKTSVGGLGAGSKQWVEIARQMERRTKLPEEEKPEVVPEEIAEESPEEGGGEIGEEVVPEEEPRMGEE